MSMVWAISNEGSSELLRFTNVFRGTRTSFRCRRNTSATLRAGRSNIGIVPSRFRMRLCVGHLLVIPSMLTTGLEDLMSVKMNWDRVRKESQTWRSCSEWIGSDAVGTTPGKEIKSSRQRQYVQTGQPHRTVWNAGLLCGKVIGFRGSDHTKRDVPLLAGA
jgi:hypothetical protein